MSSARVRTSAFTLLEITLAVAILAMMSVVIYRFVIANMTAVTLSARQIVTDARYEGLHTLLTSQWQGLTQGQGALLGEPFKMEDRSRDEITWLTGPGPGLLTRYASGEFRVTLRLRRASDSNEMEIGLVRRPKDNPGVADENADWVALLENVRSLEIRYFDPRVNSWVNRWTDTIQLPRLVRIVIQRNDTEVPWDVIIPLGRTPL